MDDMLTCPYDRSHVVSKLRMAQHLAKCEANHPHIILSTCYYDFLHRVPPEKLDEHLENCPSKEKYKTQFRLAQHLPAEAGEPSDPTKNIYLQSSTSDDKEGPQHTMQPTAPATEASDTAESAPAPTDTVDRSKGAIPKTTRPTYRYRYGSKGPTSRDRSGKGKGWSKTRQDSWDSDSSEDDD